MKFETRISKIENQDFTLRGQKLSDLIKNGKFSDVIFLTLSGRNPKEQESVLFGKLLISIIDHGAGTTSAMTTRFVASGGNSLNTAVGAGLLSIGDYHGGAIENAMKQFYAWKGMNNETIEKEVEDMITNKKTLYGFGHRVYKQGDPRVKVLLEENEKISFTSEFLFMKDIVEQKFMTLKNRNIPINIDGLIALLLCDFGFHTTLGKGFFLIGRTPGLVAHADEELRYEKPVRRAQEEDITLIKEE